jgi:hypothetical protein
MKRLATLFIHCSALLLLLPALVKADNAMDETALKASFITSFIGYTFWPNESQIENKEPFEICVIGDDPYTEIFGFFPKEGIRKRPLKSRKISENDSSETYASCHILVIRLATKKKTETLLQSIEGLPILTISEFSNYSKQKTMINLSLRNDKMVFSVNRDASSVAGIVLRSKLLRSAHKIIWSGP